MCAVGRLVSPRDVRLSGRSQCSRTLRLWSARGSLPPGGLPRADCQAEPNCFSQSPALPKQRQLAVRTDRLGALRAEPRLTALSPRGLHSGCSIND